MNRRNLLASTVALVGGLALSGCASLTSSGGVMITQSQIDIVSGIISGIESFVGNPSFTALIGATNTAKIATYLGDAQTWLVKLQTSVGQTFSVSNAQAVFSSLEQAASLAAQFIPPNPILMAVMTVLPVLATAWNMVSPAHASLNGSTMTPVQAMAILGNLPRPSVAR